MLKQGLKRKIKFKLDWPPSVNQMYAIVKGRKVLSIKTVKFYKTAHYLLIKQFSKIPKFYSKVTMLIEFHPRRKSGWDASNFFKATEDAIVKAGVIPDDQVKYLQPLAPIIHKTVCKDELPYIVVTLQET